MDLEHHCTASDIGDNRHHSNKCNGQNHLPHPWAQEFLAKDSMDELVSVLIKAKVADRLLDFMPPQKRTTSEFNEHFKVRGVEHHCCAFQ